MIVKDITIKKKKAVGIEISFQNSKLILVKADKGYIMCGYLNLETAKKLGDSAAIVRGITTIDELLEGLIVDLTSSAKKAGIKIGMTGREALSKIV